MLGIINRNFLDIDKSSFILLYKSLVRSHLEYAFAVWTPYKISLINEIESVQKRATKMVKECKKLCYRDRLKLPTLKYRRLRGDMIEVYKILNNYYDAKVLPPLIRNYDTRTRGNSLKLAHIRCNLDIKKYSFSVSVVANWNSLPDTVILSSSLNAFKNSLDRHWSQQDILYDYKSDIQL